MYMRGRHGDLLVGALDSRLSSTGSSCGWGTGFCYWVGGGGGINTELPYTIRQNVVLC